MQKKSKKRKKSWKQSENVEKRQKRQKTEKSRERQKERDKVCVREGEKRWKKTKKKQITKTASKVPIEWKVLKKFNKSVGNGHYTKFTALQKNRYFHHFRRINSGGDMKITICVYFSRYFQKVSSKMKPFAIVSISQWKKCFDPNVVRYYQFRTNGVFELWFIYATKM